ncbi:c-type cytochrome [Sulfuriflexus mobilis]|uniref:c-type cytochrome n=1 Tax=Sulfuriflexus mobilis TaxID=1811807 RepID=UPI0018D5747C|nr:c-type cytochrome [Sulfuriflexus mobilis]
MMIFLFTGLGLFANPVAADELGKKIAMQGNGKGATACIACHGVDGGGQAQAGFPRLAGLNENYLLKQMESFTSGARQNPIMAPVAKALSKNEMTAVASYFARLPIPGGSSPSPADKALLKKGEHLAKNGNWDKNIPACFACHGPQAYGVGEHFPALAGQPTSYISQQIQAWKSGQRKNDPNQLMQGVAERLSEAETMAVSAYLASLPASRQ